MRDISQVMGTKKVVTPNIPTRRAIVKTETSQREASRGSPHVKAEPGTDSPSLRKGRPAKLFLQTEGSFLAEGPAARIKRDMAGLDIGYSSPRVSHKMEPSETKYDVGTIKDVLNSYDAKSFYEDGYGDIQPHRFPLLKEKPTIKIKSEPVEDGDDLKVKIKSEFSENKTITAKPKTDSKRTLEYFRDFKDDGMLILLKLPSDLPFIKQADPEDNFKEKPKEEKEEVPEGSIGKLRLLRSGRVKLVVGEIELELTDDMPSESYMEVATIGDQDLNILGKIEWRMVFSPTLPTLITKSTQ